MKTFYTIGKIQKTYILLGRKFEMDEVDGVVGFLPCFTNKRKAKKFAQGAAVFKCS